MTTPPCNCTNPPCEGCPNALELPPLASILAVTTHPALRKAFGEGRVRVVPARGAFLMQSFTSTAWYIVTEDQCSCPSRKRVCKHRLAIQAIEQAWARPSETTLPDVEQTLAWADSLTLDTMPKLTKSRETIMAEMDDLFS